MLLNPCVAKECRVQIWDWPLLFHKIFVKSIKLPLEDKMVDNSVVKNLSLLLRPSSDNSVPWHSSVITERVSSNVLKTVSGRTYVLVGKMAQDWKTGRSQFAYLKEMLLHITYLLFVLPVKHTVLRLCEMCFIDKVSTDLIWYSFITFSIYVVVSCVVCVASVFCCFLGHRCRPIINGPLGDKSNQIKLDL